LNGEACAFAIKVYSILIPGVQQAGGGLSLALSSISCCLLTLRADLLARFFSEQAAFFTVMAVAANWRCSVSIGGVDDMPSEMKIDAALAKLEAGKFSFQMVDAIKNHTSKLERELEVMRRLHASALRELQLKEYANWRLENKLKKLNSRIRAVLRANMLTEEVYRKMAPVAIEAGKYFNALSKVAGETLGRAADGLRSGKFQAQFFRVFAKLYELLKANLPTKEEARREMWRYTIKMGENFKVLRRHAAAGVVWAAGYLSNFRKTSA
jgi:hypothetical protein